MPEPLVPALLVAAGATAASVLATRALASAVAAVRTPLQRRRRTVARADEAGRLAARAQTWFRSPAVLGGTERPADGYAGLTFDTLGLAADARDVHHTAVGAYRLLPVAPCATLDGCARLVGADAPAAGGLLVVGTCGEPTDAVAVLVLGPLVQVPLPTVPWGWVRALTTPAEDPLMPAEPALTAAEPGTEPAQPRPLHTRPQRERRMPSWRSPKHPTRRRDRVPA